MNSFKAYFKKEVLEAVRNNRYLILGTGFVFWSILNPLMLKLLPYFIKDQVPKPLLEEFIMISKLEAIHNYLGDLFSIGLLFVVFTLMGILTDEIERGRLILPYSKGVNPAGMVLAKSLHYIPVIAVFITLAFVFNYNYVSVFFSGEGLSFSELIPTILMFIIYYTFTVSLIILMSSLFNKGIITAIAVLLLSYLQAPLQNISSLNIYLPNHLLVRAGQLGNVVDDSLWITVLFTLFLSIVFNLLTIYRMKRVEVV